MRRSAVPKQGSETVVVVTYEAFVQSRGCTANQSRKVKGQGYKEDGAAIERVKNHGVEEDLQGQGSGIRASKSRSC